LALIGEVQTLGLLAGFSSSVKPSETASGQVSENDDVGTSSSDDDEADICFKLM
jgi:hypothetical protein